MLGVKRVEPSPVVDQLSRWETAGGQVRVRELTRTEVVIEMCTCTGELVESFSSSDPEVLERFASRGNEITRPADAG